MTRGHLTRVNVEPDGESGDRPAPPSQVGGRSPSDGLADYRMSGRARGLSLNTLDWYRMIGDRPPPFRTSSGADPALSAVNTAEARAFVSRSRTRAWRAVVRRRADRPAYGVEARHSSRFVAPETMYVATPSMVSRTWISKGSSTSGPVSGMSAARMT